MATSLDPLPREIADKLSQGLRSIPGVAALHPGRFGEVALLYPRHRVRGLSMSGGRLGVHIIVNLAALRPLPELADEVRATATKAIPNIPVDVYIADAADIEVPG